MNEEDETLTTASDDPRISEYWKSGVEKGERDRRQVWWYTGGSYHRGPYKAERLRFRTQLSELNHDGASWSERLETLRRLAAVEGYLTRTASRTTEIKPTAISYKARKRPENERYIGYIENWRGIERVQYRVRTNDDVEYWAFQEDGTLWEHSRLLRRGRVFQSPRLLLLAKLDQLQKDHEALETQIVQVKLQLTQLDAPETNTTTEGAGDGTVSDGND